MRVLLPITVCRSDVVFPAAYSDMLVGAQQQCKRKLECSIGCQYVGVGPRRAALTCAWSKHYTTRAPCAAQVLLLQCDEGSAELC